MPTWVPGTMNASEDTPVPGPEERPDAERDLAEHERPSHDKPETGLISDEELPEDLRPSDDNPLAKNPGDDDEPEDGPAGGTGSAAGDAAKAAGMPDMGNPGGPA